MSRYGLLRVGSCYFKSWRKKQKELIKLMDLLNELVVKIISFCGWVIILIELFT